MNQGDTHALVARAQRGDDRAMEQLLKQHHPSLVRIARQQAMQRLDLVEDLLQVARIEFITQVRRYQPGRGVDLGAFAREAIIGACRREKDRLANPITLPRRLCDSARKAAGAAAHLTTLLGREPTEDEIRQAAGLTPEQLAQVRQIPATGIQWEFTGGDGDAAEDWLATPESWALDPQRLVLDRIHLADLLNHLDGRERFVVEHHFGIDGAAELTFAQLGERLGVGAQRSHQLKNEAIGLLRHRLKIGFRRGH